MSFRINSFSTINEAMDLQYKAIITLYTYAEQQKIITTDISGNLDTIVADAIINKNTVDRLVNVVDKLVAINGGMVNISKEHTDINERMINLAGKHNKMNDKHETQIKMIVEKIDEIILNRRTEKIGYFIDFVLIICAITTVFFYK